MTVAEYNQCVDKFADSVYRFILKNMKDEDEARDVVQEAYAKMWEKSRNIVFEKGRAYIFSAAYHTMIDRIRKSKRLSLTDEKVEYPAAEGPGYSDVSEVLHTALEKLPAIQKHVVLLRDYEGYKYEEIGEITGLNESQVKVYIYRARKALKTYLVSMDKVI